MWSTFTFLLLTSTIQGGCVYRLPSNRGRNIARLEDSPNYIRYAGIFFVSSVLA